MLDLESTVVVPTSILDKKWDIYPNEKWVAIDIGNERCRMFDHLPEQDEINDDTKCIHNGTYSNEPHCNPLEAEDIIAIVNYLKSPQ